MRKIQLILVILFLVSVYFGFLYTLSMMTDITLLNFYQDFLDPSVKAYVTEAQTINQLIFRLSLFLVVITAIFYGFKTKKTMYGKYKIITALSIGLISLGFNLFMLFQLKSLDQLYQVTDTSWPADYPITAEQLGYVEPGHFFIGSGPTVFILTTIISLCLILWMLFQLVFKLKERVE